MDRERILPRSDLPFVSFIVPTLNSERVLDACLESIAGQDYPRDRLEVVVADGGSEDATLSIIRSFEDRIPTRIVENHLKTGEAGKSAGVRASSGDILAFVDSDNVLPAPEWLERMIAPFYDTAILASEPIEYTYRPADSAMTRYCALLGMNDPLCLFLGNYDRYCALTGRWTEIPHREEDRGDYLKVEFAEGPLPTMGANGFLIRRSVLAAIGIGDYLFDVDMLVALRDGSTGRNVLQVAKVKTGVVHIFSGDLRTFARKQRRRVRDYFHYQGIGARRYPWGRASRRGLLAFVTACLAVVPLFVQSFLGYTRKRDAAWFLHPVACWITLWEYGAGTFMSRIRTDAMSRDGWKQ